MCKILFYCLDLFPKADVITGNEQTLNGKFAGGPNIVFLNGHEWKEQRKVANPAFRRSMPVKLFGKLTQEMFKAMESMGDTVDASDLMERWTLEAIGKAGFGKQRPYKKKSVWGLLTVYLVCFRF